MGAPKFNHEKANQMFEKHSRKSPYSSKEFDRFLKLSNEAVVQNDIIKDYLSRTAKDGYERNSYDFILKDAFDKIFELKKEITKILNTLQYTVNYPKMVQKLINNTLKFAFAKIDERLSEANKIYSTPLTVRLYNFTKKLYGCFTDEQIRTIIDKKYYEKLQDVSSINNVDQQNTITATLGDGALKGLVLPVILDKKL